MLLDGQIFMFNKDCTFWSSDDDPDLFVDDDVSGNTTMKVSNRTCAFRFLGFFKIALAKPSCQETFVS